MAYRRKFRVLVIALENSHLSRREGQPVPDSVESAAERFHCQAYRITMSGQCCANTFNTVRTTKAENRTACIGCPAGQARAELLGAISPLKCPVFKHGAPCGKQVEEGKTYCSAHRLHSKVIENQKIKKRGPRVDWDSPGIIARLRSTPALQMAEELGVSITTIRKICTQKGITPPKKKRNQ